MGVVAITTGNQRLSILALAAFFVLGAWLLARVRGGGAEAAMAASGGASGR
jgi:MFS-type transporter involved in bile tolerance (Atg22 family)